MRVLFASAEVSPFAKTGGLGDVCGSLPNALRNYGHEVHVFCPFYAEVRRWCDSHGVRLEDGGGGRLDWGNWSADYHILSTRLPGGDVPIHFIANDGFFDRGGLYWGRADGYDDNLERFAFFCRAVIAAVERLGLVFDIVHGHDWQTALLPIYLHAGLRWTRNFQNARSIYTIHNLNYSGRYPPERFPVLGLHQGYWTSHGLEYYGDLVLMKGGILFADSVTTVSPTYAREIQTSGFGAGFDGLLRERSRDLYGILNGIDVDEWNPRTDPTLPAHFDAQALEGKAACKRALRKEAGLDPTPRAPLVAAISRLVEQKGFDLFIPLLPWLVGSGWQIVALGTGDHELEQALRAAAEANPRSVAAWAKFDPALAHRIIAGADAIAIPSRYEPCGLNQMYALRYGTVPIVRMTGGLADTIVPWDGSNESHATGFGFVPVDRSALAQALLIARMAFGDRSLWSRLQKNGMTQDFSWESSAGKYDRLYRST